MKKFFIFTVKFFGIFAFLYFLLLSFPPIFLQEWLAFSLSSLFGLSFSGIKIFVDSGAFAVTESCTGLVSAAILASVVFSLRLPSLKKKVLLFAAGSCLLFAANFLRLFLVVWVGVSFGSSFAGFVHKLSWLSTAAIILVVWFFLTRKFAGVRNFSSLL